MTQPWYFVADIGGTNARFAAFHGTQKVHHTVHATKAGEDLLGLAEDFVKSTFPEAPLAAVIAGAGPIKGNVLQLTNAAQSLSTERLGQATKAQHAFIINDFAAAAWSTLAVVQSDLSVFSGPKSLSSGTRLVIGPGTGLGVGALVDVDGGYHSVSGEGGHIGVAPNDRYEMAVFEALRDIWPEIFFSDGLTFEAEGILSGTGLPCLYEAIQRAEGLSGPVLQPREIFSAAHAATDPAAVKCIQLFKSHIARVAGDLALAFGASGVYFVGGIAMKNPWMFDADFIARFHAGGRFTDLRKSMGLYLLKEPDFGLRGALRFAQEAVGMQSS